MAVHSVYFSQDLSRMEPRSVLIRQSSALYIHVTVHRNRFLFK